MTLTERYGFVMETTPDATDEVRLEARIEAAQLIEELTNEGAPRTLIRRLRAQKEKLR